MFNYSCFLLCYKFHVMRRVRDLATDYIDSIRIYLIQNLTEQITNNARCTCEGLNGESCNHVSSRIRTYWYGLPLAFGSYDNVFTINTSSILWYASRIFLVLFASTYIYTLNWQFVRESVLTGVVFSHNLLIAGLVYWKLMRHDIHIECII